MGWQIESWYVTRSSHGDQQNLHFGLVPGLKIYRFQRLRVAILLAYLNDGSHFGEIRPRSAHVAGHILVKFGPERGTWWGTF